MMGMDAIFPFKVVAVVFGRFFSLSNIKIPGGLSRAAVRGAVKGNGKHSSELTRPWDSANPTTPISVSDRADL